MKPVDRSTIKLERGCNVILSTSASMDLDVSSRWMASRSSTQVKLGLRTLQQVWLHSKDWKDKAHATSLRKPSQASQAKFSATFIQQTLPNVLVNRILVASKPEPWPFHLLRDHHQFKQSIMLIKSISSSNQPVRVKETNLISAFPIEIKNEDFFGPPHFY